MKSFPNPLTPSEEKEYIQKYTEGDLQAKHILIERNLRLVAHVIKKYQYVDEDPEDLISIGTIGLIKAIVTFNPSKGNRLAAYASKCVENEILMHLRARKKTSKEISLYEPIGTDREGNEIKLYDIIETDEDDIPERVCLKENIQKLYEKVENELSQREKLVLKMRYGLYGGEEYTQREVAKQLGISRSYVSRIEKSAVEKLQPFKMTKTYVPVLIFIRSQRLLSAFVEYHICLQPSDPAPHITPVWNEAHSPAPLHLHLGSKHFRFHIIPVWLHDLY